MGIGGALAEARTEAGLTVAQVSERTRIRETIIRSIEIDDYSSCGGDYYARGHIRAIARVVGADPVPLIEEYDASHMPPPEPAEPADGLGGHGWRLSSLQRIVGSGAGTTGLDTNTRDGNGQAAHPAALGDADTGAGVPGGITAAEAFRPWMPLEPSRRLPRLTVALALILLVAIGVLSYLLASGGSSPSPAVTGHHKGAAHHPARSGVASAHHVGNSAPPARSAVSAVPLTPASAAAFGPGGIGTGDDSQQASLAIDGNDSTAWKTDWYSTADFGGLQPGTGLLLDMGKQVSVTSVRMLLGAAPGGRLQLLAGNTPSLAGLQVVARAHLPGGALTVPIDSPVTARYLLIWFTRLPPDSSGTYQDSISSVSLSGTP